MKSVIKRIAKWGKLSAAKWRKVPVAGPDICDFDLWIARLEGLLECEDCIDVENGSMHQRVAEALKVVRERKAESDARTARMQQNNGQSDESFRLVAA